LLFNVSKTIWKISYLFLFFNWKSQLQNRNKHALRPRSFPLLFLQLVGVQGGTHNCWCAGRDSQLSWRDVCALEHQRIVPPQHFFVFFFRGSFISGIKFSQKPVTTITRQVDNIITNSGSTTITHVFSLWYRFQVSTTWHLKSYNILPNVLLLKQLWITSASTCHSTLSSSDLVFWPFFGWEEGRMDLNWVHSMFDKTWVTVLIWEALHIFNFFCKYIRRNTEENALQPRWLESVPNYKLGIAHLCKLLSIYASKEDIIWGSWCSTWNITQLLMSTCGPCLASNAKFICYLFCILC
jgi:hypothetical protein